MSNVLLDFAVGFSASKAAPAVSNGFLRKLCVVARGDTVTETQINSPDDLSADTEDLSAVFQGGLTGFTLLTVTNDYTSAQLETYLTNRETDFYTIYLFSECAVLNSVQFKGVKAWTDTASEAPPDRSIVFHDKNDYGALFAISALLFGNEWRNHQYLSLSSERVTGVSFLGEANALFDKRRSFYIQSDEGKNLGFFSCGGKSVISAYVQKELHLSIQNAHLKMLSGMQPNNIAKNRRLLTQKASQIVSSFIQRQLLDPESINQISIEQSGEDFVVKGEMKTTHAQALWRVKIDAQEL